MFIFGLVGNIFECLRILPAVGILCRLKLRSAFEIPPTESLIRVNAIGIVCSNDIFIGLENFFPFHIVIDNLSPKTSATENYITKALLININYS